MIFTIANLTETDIEPFHRPCFSVAPAIFFLIYIYTEGCGITYLLLIINLEETPAL